MQLEGRCGRMSSMKDKRADSLEQALREAGVRVTRQRAALLRVIAAAEDHPDAAELHARAVTAGAGVSLATVYRTLTTLQAQGVIERRARMPRAQPQQKRDVAHHGRSTESRPSSRRRTASGRKSGTS